MDPSTLIRIREQTFWVGTDLVNVSFVYYCISICHIHVYLFINASFPSLYPATFLKLTQNSTTFPWRQIFEIPRSPNRTQFPNQVPAGRARLTPSTHARYAHRKLVCCCKRTVKTHSHRQKNANYRKLRL